jgi:hypothetical protein
MAYKPLNPYPAFDALRNVGPKTPYPKWQVPTAISPSLSSWMSSPAASPEDTAPRAPLTNLTGEPGGSPVPQDPEVIDYKNKQAMKSYLEDRMFGATRAGDPNEAAALSGLMESNQSYLDASPITKQGIEGDAMREAEVKAIQAGFTGTSPQRVQGQPNTWRNEPTQQPIQQAASVGRGMEMFKANVPSEQSKIETQGRTDVAKIGVDQANSMNRQLMDMLSGGKGGANLRSYNPRTGGFTLQSTPPPVRSNLTSSMTKQLADAVGAHEKAKSMWSGGGDVEGTKQAITTAILGTINQLRIAPDIQQLGVKLRSDPSTSGLTPDQQIFVAEQSFPDIFGSDPAALQQLRDYLQVINYLPPESGQ